MKNFLLALLHIFLALFREIYNLFSRFKPERTRYAIQTVGEKSTEIYLISFTFDDTIAMGHRYLGEGYEKLFSTTSLEVSFSFPQKCTMHWIEKKTLKQYQVDLDIDKKSVKQLNMLSTLFSSSGKEVLKTLLVAITNQHQVKVYITNGVANSVSGFESKILISKKGVLLKDPEPVDEKRIFS